MLAVASHIGLVSILLVIIVAALAYWICTAVGLPQVVGVLVAVLVVLVGLGFA
jgi:hypothetical protein